MSPIRRENRSRYPADWGEIARAVKQAAGWQCTCDGMCGLDSCAPRCLNVHAQPSPTTGKMVVLTVAHLNHWPEDSDPTLLRALCAPCHLRYDAQEHAEVRRARRRRGVAPDDAMLF